MNVLVTSFITVICLAVSQGQDTLLSNKRYCGFQHSDEYFRTDDESKASVDEFPWIAALIYKFIRDGTKAILCAGSLINRRYVLTAAQCILHTDITTLEAVRLGEYNIKTETDCILNEYQQNQCYNSIDFGIEEKIPHAKYNKKTAANDIGLLRLDRTIEDYEENIRPICLPDSETTLVIVGETLYVSGWGRKSHGDAPANLKKKIQTVLITNNQCAKEFISRSVYDTQVCTVDYRNNSGYTCQGDVGAPLMTANKKNQWYIEGISSWGGRCGSGTPEVHTRVSKYINWIQENMKQWT